MADNTIDDAFDFLDLMGDALPNWTFTGIGQNAENKDIVVRQVRAGPGNFGILSNAQQARLAQIVEEMILASDTETDLEGGNADPATEAETKAGEDLGDKSEADISALVESAVNEIENEVYAVSKPLEEDEVEAMGILIDSVPPTTGSNRREPGIKEHHQDPDLAHLVASTKALSITIPHSGAGVNVSTAQATFKEEMKREEEAPFSALSRRHGQGKEEEEESSNEENSPKGLKQPTKLDDPGKNVKAQPMEEEEALSNSGSFASAWKESSSVQVPTQRMREHLGDPHPTAQHADGQFANAELVITPKLAACGLQFNTRHMLIICQSCEAGLPFRSIANHFSTPPTKRAVFDGSEWKYGDFSSKHVSKIGTKQITEIVNSLIENGYIQQKSDIKNSNNQEWTSPPTPSPHVAGIRVFENAVQCGCGHVTAARSTMRSKHKSTCNKYNTEEDLKLVSAQTLCELRGLVKYFAISSVSDNIQPPAIITVPKETAADRLRRKMAPTQRLFTNPVPEEDVRRVLPVFVRLRIHAFFSQYNRTKIWQHFVRDKTSTAYSRLQKLIVKSFARNVKRISSFNPSVLVRMTNCTPDVVLNSQRRPFTALTQRESIAAYASMEVKAIWAIFCAYRLQTQGSEAAGFPEKPQNPFVFDETQQDALQDLFVAVSSTQYSPSAASKALGRAQYSLYFPSNPQSANNVFISPIVVFLAMECLETTGDYRRIYLIPPAIAKIQYAVRLCATVNFHRIFGHTFPPESDDEEETPEPPVQAKPDDNKLLAECLKFCAIHLQDYNFSPFSTVRHWLHEFSVFAKSTTQNALVWWRNDTVTIGSTVINFNKYKSELHRILSETETLVIRDVLFGLYTLEEAKKEFKISALATPSNQLRSTLGYGILLDVRDGTLLNPESTEVYAKMEQGGCLGLSENQPIPAFDRGQSIVWLGKINEAMRRVMCLSHVLQGPPGRMTEESLLPLTTTVDGQSAIFFNQEEETGGFVSAYHKSTSITGDHRHILRLLPQRIFTLLFILIRLIRPIEAIVLFDFVVKPEKQERTFNEYTQRIFASHGRGWNEKRMRTELAAFFHRFMGIQMGTALYRHFAIAVQRHYPITNYGVYDTDDKRRPNLIVDKMAGHSTKIAESLYAVTDGAIESKLSEAAYIRVSKDWHTLHGFETKAVI